MTKLKLAYIILKAPKVRGGQGERIMTKKTMPTTCPSCNGLLRVNRLICPGCTTGVDGDLELPVLSRLGTEEQTFVLSLLKSSGSLKEIARLYKISYPTVRNRLDDLIEQVKSLEQAGGGHRKGE